MRQDRYGEIYQRSDQAWDWRVRSVGNHEITSTSGGQGFRDPTDAMRAAVAENPDIDFEVL